MPVIVSNNRIISKNNRIIHYSTIPRDGLIGEWLFNGNANDTSGAGHNGTVNGATLTTNRKSIVNTAYLFNGLNDYIEVGDYCNMGLLDMTISFWASLNNTNTYQGLVQKSYGGTTTNKWAVITNITTNKYRATINYTPYTLLNFIDSNNSFSGIWEHIVVIFDRSGYLKMFINGILQSQTQDMSMYSSVDVTNIFNLRFGCYTSATGSQTFFAKGKIDDIRIYNRVLTLNEIKALYEE